MASQRFRISRIEGGMELERTDGGATRIRGGAPRIFERMLLRKHPQDAVFLTQQISADSGISHAMAFLKAWEAAGKISLPSNAETLREILHLLSVLHAHLRQFYQKTLPDYLPPGSLAKYGGTHPILLKMKAGLSKAPASHWTNNLFNVPLTPGETEQLWEHVAWAQQVMGVLGRMIALIGGKFPVVMSLVPGGMSCSLGPSHLLMLWDYLESVYGFLDGVPFQDGELLVARWPELTTLGRASDSFLSVGSGEDATAVESALFPSGILIAEKLDPFTPEITESIHRAFYRIPHRPSPDGLVPLPFADKAGAYSWIKAPRFQGHTLETGSLARFMISDMSGGKIWPPRLLRSLRSILGRGIQRWGGVAGRMMTRMAEVRMLAGRVKTLIGQLDPDLPLFQPGQNADSVSGEGRGYAEGPAGAIQHRLILEKGRIAHLSIIASSAWNGTPSDERNQTGPIEMALEKGDFDLNRVSDQLSMSRVVHSFAFSMSDAVH